MTDTAYDQVAYPSVIHVPTQPERLAISARLAGLDPAPLDTARVLEIGGGTCLGLIAFAAAHPRSECHGFDLAANAIARGRELAGSEVPNVTLVVEDICAAHRRYHARSFDYVIAHGVYSWVPEPVRQATLALIAHVLSERGVALLSYNAMPGGHVRMLLREMVLHEVEGIDDPEQRVSAAYAFLESYAEPKEDDEPLLVGLRRHAGFMAKRPPSVLFHDEMGDHFAPQSLTQVVGDAAVVGLRHLTDAGRNRGLDGFLTLDAGEVDDPDETVLRAAQARDYLNLAFFRATLLVRGEAPLDRRIDPRRIDELWLSAALKSFDNGDFGHGEDRFAISDEALAGALRALSAVHPARRRIGDIVSNDDQRFALIGMYREWFAEFHLGPPSFILEADERPHTGAWIRGLLSRGEETIVSLAMRTMRIDQLGLRKLLIAADGTRTLRELATIDHGMAPGEVEGAFAAAARRALLTRP